MGFAFIVVLLALPDTLCVLMHSSVNRSSRTVLCRAAFSPGTQAAAFNLHTLQAAAFSLDTLQAAAFNLHTLQAAACQPSHSAGRCLQPSHSAGRCLQP
ncbi:hypothetical protein JOQ06_020092 [Pogonophryne albipinna]|uniref:Uncharacterized protein n=1 Tax=Pogonophryne albipinna TaxID=1090488 RepID=A0AAD6FWK0_9TELE|nr:hypothetical protein JOQ06_020092 [Pogonophryne albipinna]